MPSNNHLNHTFKIFSFAKFAAVVVVVVQASVTCFSHRVVAISNFIVTISFLTTHYILCERSVCQTSPLNNMQLLELKLNKVACLKTSCYDTIQVMHHTTVSNMTRP